MISPCTEYNNILNHQIEYHEKCTTNGDDVLVDDDFDRIQWVLGFNVGAI